ncbi:MAG: 3-oxoacid CoA-transferase [Dehalococcoidia bacterium]|nr:3-oxoacid CoA-transferase [Dehalococcoidia bacterium]
MTMGVNKVFASAKEAIFDIEDGASIIFGGPGMIHFSPTTLIWALKEKGVKNLTAILNFPGIGPTNPLTLADNKQIKKLIGSFGGIAGVPTLIEEQIRQGEVEYEMVPQGVLCERLRAGGAGIPAFYSPTGVDTMIEEGKEVRYFNGKKYLLEKALTADFAFIPAYKADKMGNLVFRRTMRNFNPVFATAARVVIAEVDEIVETGDIDPDHVVTPGIYVDRVIKTEVNRRDIATQFRTAMAKRVTVGGSIKRPAGMKPGLTRELTALRVAKELREGQWVNLGFGLPILVSQFMPDGVNLHSEMGLMAYGHPPQTDAEFDAYVTDAAGMFVTTKPGSSCCTNLEAFAMARGGRLNTVVLGAFQVSQKGDLANVWSPKMGAPGVGGAMDLVVGGSRVIAAMEHVTEDGEPRILKQCTYKLTAPRCVSLIVTDLAVIQVTDEGLLLREVAPGWTPAEVQKYTDAPLTVSPDCREISM